MDTITDGEKQVVQTFISNALQVMFANGKGASMIRTAVLLVCGAKAEVSNDTLSQVAAAAIALAMLVWSWIEKHKAAGDFKRLARDAMQVSIAADAILKQRMMPPLTTSQMPKSTLPKIAEIKPTTTVLLLLVCGLVLGGCRTVTVNEVPGGGPVYINQSYSPDFPISVLTGLDTNAWKAIAQGVAEGSK